MDLYGEGLARIMAALADGAATAGEISGRLVADGVVASLLLVHDLYPVALETRVLEALASVRPYMESHGGNVELDRIEDGVAHLRLIGHCDGCPASLSTLELAIKDALEEQLPIYGRRGRGARPSEDGRSRSARAAPVWLELGHAGAWSRERCGRCRWAASICSWRTSRGRCSPYRSECPCCGAALGDAALEGEILSCARCKHGFALTRQAVRSAPTTSTWSRCRCSVAQGPRAERGPRAMSAAAPPGAEPPVVAGLRRLARARPDPLAAAATGARCDLCGGKMADDHRHLLSLEDRRILCSCEPCCAMRAGDPGLRPTGTRSLLLEGFELDDELWAKFQIPIGLAFFFLSDANEGVVALYPSPAGATESELYLEAWNDLVAANPMLETLEAEAEALVVNRIGDRRPTRSSRSTAATSSSARSSQLDRDLRRIRRLTTRLARSSPGCAPWGGRHDGRRAER